MALSWGETQTTKKEGNGAISWDETQGLLAPTTKPITPGVSLSTEQIDALHTAGFETIGTAPPKEPIKDTWIKRVGRFILPRTMEVKLGITEPNYWDIAMKREDARLSYLREKKFIDLYKKEVTESPTIPEGYKEPTSFTGQVIEGVKSGYISSIKGGFGYFAETLGINISSPEMIKWGSDLGDKATIELLKRPELFEPEDLEPFFEGGFIDRRWYGRRIGQALPFMATAITAATLGGLVGGPPGAYAGGYGSVFILEKGNSYKKYIDEGVPSDKANTYSSVYGSIAAIIENAFGVSPVRIGTQIGVKGTERVVYDSFKSYLRQEIPKIGVKTLKTSLTEGGEEVAQSITEDLVLKFYKEETPIFSKELMEDFASGAVASIPFGATHIRIPDIQPTDSEGIRAIDQSVKTVNDALLKIEEKEEARKAKLEPIKIDKEAPTVKLAFPKNKYKFEVLEEVGALENLPEIDPTAFDWTPPKLTYKNPYTKVMYKALDAIGRVWDSKAPTALKQSQTQEVSQLLKERQRVYDGLVKKYYEETVRPISKLTTEDKTQIGEMIFKRIDIPDSYKAIVKDIDVKIGQLGLAIVNVDKEMVKKGLLKKEQALLTEEVWMTNLGEYARTLYVKIEDGETKITTESALNKEGVIDKTAFKKKLTDEEWGANALSTEGKTIKEIEEYSAEELKEIGIEAKEKNGWTVQADYILSKTFQEMSKAYSSRLFQKAIVENPRLFTTKKQEALKKDFVSSLDVLLNVELSSKFKDTITKNTKLLTAKLEEANKKGIVPIDNFKQNILTIYEETLGDNRKLIIKKVNEARKKGFIPIKDLIPKALRIETKEGWRTISQSGKLGPLANGYIHPGLQDEVRIFLLEEGQDKMIAMFHEPLSWWKAFKVAGNPPTVIRNWISGAFIQTDLAGYPVWDPRNTHKYVQAVNAYVTKNDLYKKLRDGGQYGSDYFSIEIAEDEMARIVSKAEKSNNPMSTYTEGILAKTQAGLKDAKQLFSYYGQIDHIQRTYLALCAIKDGASTAQAVHFSNKWELDYRFVPKIIDYLRKGIPGYLFPFISFYTLMAPRIAEVIITRPWVLIKYPIVIAAFNAASMTFMGADEDEVENAKPEYLTGKGYVLVMPFKDKNGDFVFMDLSYTLPFGEIDTLFQDKDAVVGMMKSPGVVNALLNLFNNYDTFTERKIYKDTDSLEDKTKKITEYLVRNFSPGIVVHVLNIYRVAQGQTTGYPIKKDKSTAQVVAKSLGISMYSGGFNEAFWKINNLQKEIQEIQSSIRVFMTTTKASPEEKRNKMIQYQDAIRERVEDIQKIGNAMPTTNPKSSSNASGKGGSQSKYVPFGE